MPRDRDRGRIIAHIAEPGSDARNAVRKMRREHGDENTASALIPSRGQILIGPRTLIESMRQKTRVRHILTGKGSKHDLV